MYAIVCVCVQRTTVEWALGLNSGCQAYKTRALTCRAISQAQEEDSYWSEEPSTGPDQKAVESQAGIVFWILSFLNQGRKHAKQAPYH